MPQTVRKQKKNSREAAPELLRIIGALMVIGTHLKQGYFTGNGSLITCGHLLADPKDILMLYWYTNFGFISSIGIVLTVWGIIPWIQKK